MFFSSRAATRWPACSDRFRPFTAMRTEAAHLVTVPCPSARLALGALDACICFFSLERSAAAEVSRLKPNGIKELYPHAFLL